MDRADIGTLLAVKNFIYKDYYKFEEDLNTRLILKDIMDNLEFYIGDILEEMHNDQ